MMNKTIVFIDDEQDILDAVQIILESSGFRVVTFTHMKSVQDIADARPDLILLDILLVGQSGKDICQSIKKTPALHSVPIIMLSAHPLSTLKTVMKQAGADGYLQKPFELDSLVTTVKEYVTGGEPQPKVV